MRIPVLLAAASLGAVLSGPAAAITCYTVLDRNDNVIYRDTYPPVDMSDQGVAERERMRKRGEHLLAVDAERCPGIEFFIGSAGSSTLNVDQVVSGMSMPKALGTAGVGNDQPSAAGGAGATPPSQRAPASRSSAPAKR